MCVCVCSIHLLIGISLTGPLILQTIFQFFDIYHPQTSLGQGNIFRSVCQEFYSQGWGVCLIACWDTPLPRDQRQAPLTPTPLGTRGRHPPTRGRHPPRSSACWEIQATSGRYASCWNAILLLIDF